MSNRITARPFRIHYCNSGFEIVTRGKYLNTAVARALYWSQLTGTGYTVIYDHKGDRVGTVNSRHVDIPQSAFMSGVSTIKPQKDSWLKKKLEAR